MKKSAQNLAIDYELEEPTAAAFYSYILESLINGNRQQCIDLFLEMNDHSRYVFLAEFLEHDNKIQSSCLRICLKAQVNP